MIGATVLVLALPACGFPFSSEGPGTTYRNLEDDLDPDFKEHLPAVSIVINAAGGDAVDVYSEGSEGTRITMAEDAAEWLGADLAIAEPHLFFDDVATAQLDQRLVTRQGNAWVLRFNTEALLPIVHDAGYEGANLFICHPSVETRVDSSRAPDFDAAYAGCLNGVGWEVLDERPVTVSLSMLPEVTDYLIFVAATLLSILLLTALAWVLGNRLREGPYRRRNAGAVALGIVSGLFAIGVLAAATGIIAAEAGPSDNLALARNLGVGPVALSAGIPALVGAVPGLLFMVLLVKQRPWPEDPLPRGTMPWPAPPPPPLAPGSSPPPVQ